MPNYCYNELKIKGNEQDVTNLISKYQDCEIVDGVEFKYISFEKILPTPLKDDMEVIDDWYNWRIDKWGTKWNCFNVSSFKIEETNEKDIVLFTTQFMTAWCCPLGIYDYLMEEYKDSDIEFEIHYDIEDDDCYNELKFTKGKIVNECCVEC